MLHTAESNFSNFVIEYLGKKSKPNAKIFYPVHQGPRWDRIMKKMEVENLVTHPLSYKDVSSPRKRSTVPAFIKKDYLAPFGGLP